MYLKGGFNVALQFRLRWAPFRYWLLRAWAAFATAAMLKVSYERLSLWVTDAARPWIWSIFFVPACGWYFSRLWRVRSFEERRALEEGDLSRTDANIRLNWLECILFWPAAIAATVVVASVFRDLR